MKGMRFLQLHNGAEGSSIMAQGIIRDVTKDFALVQFLSPAPGFSQLLPFSAIPQFILFPTDGEMVAFIAARFPAQALKPAQEGEEQGTELANAMRLEKLKKALDAEGAKTREKDPV